MISTIMPSYLGDYLNAASNREHKFIRAVQSFLDQPYQDKELVIVADGCDITERLYNEHFAGNKEIVFAKIEKQSHFSGHVRNFGIDAATGQYINYLDTDDILFGNYLAEIAAGFSAYESPDWVYFNDYVAQDPSLGAKRMRGVDLQYGCIGTSMIAHKKSVSVRWPDGYNHDWKFIYSMIERYQNRKCIHATGYCVCHLPAVLDL